MIYGIIWLVLSILLFIIEIITPFFLFGMFALSALLTAGLAFIFPHMIYLQIIIFVVSSVILLIFVRKIFLKYFNKDDRGGATTNVDSMIGKKHRLYEDVDNDKNTGAIMIDGVRWRAVSADDDVKISKDSIVEVISIDGTHLIVKKS